MFCPERFKLSLDILENLSKVPRFQTIAMFLDKQETAGKYKSQHLFILTLTFPFRAGSGVQCCGRGCRPVYYKQVEETLWGEELVVHSLWCVGCACIINEVHKKKKKKICFINILNVAHLIQ